MSEADRVTSIRQAAAACNVTPPVVRRWLSLGLIPEPPWTQQQLRKARDLTDPEGRRRGNRAAHGTIARWNAGCSCTECRKSQSGAARRAGGPKRRSASCRAMAATSGRDLRRPVVPGGGP